MALSTAVRVSLSAKQSSTVDMNSSEDNITRSLAISLANGTAAGQADRIYQKTNTLAASANVDLDLAGGVTDVNGAAITFVKVKGLYVDASSANTNNVVIGAAASNGFVGPFGAATHTLAVRPGGVLLLAVGEIDLNAYGVVAATGDLLRIANGGAGTAVTYSIIIWGTSA